MERVYKEGLHKALISFDVMMMKELADKLSLDFQILVSAGCLLSEYSKRGVHLTPLQAAIFIGNYRLCKDLIHEGANFFSLSFNVLHPLSLALELNRFKIATLLIDSGADVCLSQHGFFPMYFALKHLTPDYIVESIIKAGFSPDAATEEVYKSTSLHMAVACNNVPVVKLLMNQKADCNVTDCFQEYTPVHIAAKHKLPEMIRLLADNGANLDCECKEGLTPLFYAIMNDDVDAVFQLIQYGASIHYLSSVKLINPLNFSAFWSKGEITEVLIRHGANAKVVTPGTGNLALHCVALSQRNKTSDKACKDSESIVELLIKSGSEIDLPNANGYTPLQLAIKEENYIVTELLVKEGAAVNRKLDHGTNFHFVSRNGSKELVKVFLEFGADYCARDNSHVTPYHLAALNPEKSILKLFWKFGCPYDLPFYDTSRKLEIRSDILSALENQKKFLSGIQQNNTELMEEALLNGAEVRCCSLEMLSPLHSAVTSGSHSCVLLMLRKGVPPNILDANGQTPLHLAANHGHFLVCCFLLGHGASFDTKSKSDGVTPLDLAVMNNHYSIISLLKTISEIFESENENNIIKVLEQQNVEKYQTALLLTALINSVNRKGETLLAISLRKGYVHSATRIMDFRLNMVFPE